MSPKEFLEELGVTITEENESDDCEFSWSMVCDIMATYADRVNNKTLNTNPIIHED